MASQGWCIGMAAEDVAVEWLRERGYFIVERNWRSGSYEIDIIATKWNELHFVEVKSRRSGGWQSAEEAMTPHKLASITKCARHYLASHVTSLEPIFDLIAVDVDDKGAFVVRMIPNII
ncbi:MAG: YraN family protein [Rikenellaceae bacterium]